MKASLSPVDKIRLYGLNETIYWSDLDRWDYTEPENPTTTTVSTYTLMSLQHTFIALIVLSILQFIAIFAVKIWISKDFRKECHWTNKGIHVLENLNFASPFADWDDGDFSIQEFKERARDVSKEMILTQAVNFSAAMTMLVPLWFTGSKKEFWVIFIGNFSNLVLL